MKSNHILAFDIGGTYIKWGVIDCSNNKIVEQDKFPTRADELSAANIIKTIANKANELLDKYKSFIGCGISSAGAFNEDTGVQLLDLNTIHGYEGLNVIKTFNKYCKLPVKINNDCKCALLAEARLGELRGEKNGVLIAIGSGIGSSILIDGKVYNGINGCAGEIGMIKINNKFFEIDYSIKHFIHKCQKYYNKDVSGEFILEDKKRPKEVEKIVDEWYDAIAQALTYYIAIINPSKVVFTGAVCHNNAFSIKRLQNTLMDKAVKPIISFKNTKLCTSTLKGYAQLHGAAFLILEDKK